MTSDCILLAHGGGGELTRRLLAGQILPALSNPLLDPLTDSARFEVPAGTLCMTTDGYVVWPLEFPGGDIGRLAVCGTVNDLAVCGARPIALSLGVIAEEGLPMTTLRRVIDSIAAAAREARVPIATGDTKVVERRTGEGLTLTTAGVGIRRDDVALDPSRIAPGDTVIVSGRIAEHGLAVMSAREDLPFATQVASDVAPLAEMVHAMLDAAGETKFLRDPTRGGLAGVLADLAESTGLSIEVDEGKIPLSPAARNTAEMLGLDPLTVANEGKVVAVTAAEDADAAVGALRAHPYGQEAEIIGTFTDARPAVVELITRVGGRRIVQRPYGEDLPRIC